MRTTIQGTKIYCTCFVSIPHKRQKFLITGFKGVLLGDSAYPIRHYLLTPYNKVTKPSQEWFNVAHKRTRVKVEQTIGILKGR